MLLKPHAGWCHISFVCHHLRAARSIRTLCMLAALLSCCIASCRLTGRNTRVWQHQLSDTYLSTNDMCVALLSCRIASAG
jgi:hypothetical protein